MLACLLQKIVLHASCYKLLSQVKRSWSEFVFLIFKVPTPDYNQSCRAYKQHVFKEPPNPAQTVVLAHAVSGTYPDSPVLTRQQPTSTTSPAVQLLAPGCAGASSYALKDFRFEEEHTNSVASKIAVGNEWYSQGRTLGRVLQYDPL